MPQRAVQQNQSMQTVFTVGAGNKIEARAGQDRRARRRRLDDRTGAASPATAWWSKAC